MNFGGHKEHLKANVLGPPPRHSGLSERDTMHPQTWETDTAAPLSYTTAYTAPPQPPPPENTNYPHSH